MAGYEKNLPDGCRWDAAVDTYDEAQLDIADYDPTSSSPSTSSTPGPASTTRATSGPGARTWPGS